MPIYDFDVGHNDIYDTENGDNGVCGDNDGGRDDNNNNCYICKKMLIEKNQRAVSE